MAQLIRLKRNNTGTPWGFRMNGGTDLGQPLHIAKVSYLVTMFIVVLYLCARVRVSVDRGRGNGRVS